MWETVKLEKVCKIISGNSIPAKKKEEHLTGVEGMPYVATKDVGLDGSINYENGVYIPDEYRSNFKISPAGATLICAEGGSAGRKIAFSNEDCCFVNKLFSLQPDKNIIPKFIYYYTLSSEFQSQFKEAMHGLIGGVSLSKIRDFSISVPPLAEQQRIVAKLDAAFAEIDEAIRVTSQMTKNLVRLNETFLSDCLSKITSASTPKNMGEVISFLTDYHANGSYKILKENVELRDEPDYAWMVRSTDFEQNFKNPLKYINKNAYEFLSKSKVFEGDILMSKIGNAGKVYLVPKLSQPASLAMNMFLIRLNERDILPEFLFRFLESQMGRAQIAKRLKGATTKTITKDNVRSIPIPTANIETQVSLISDVNKSEQSVNETLGLLERKLSLLNSLKSAILAQELQSEAA